MTYIWLDHTVLSAPLVYFVISCFQKLRHSMNVVIPIGITEAAELYACVKRIEHLLRAEEVQPINTNNFNAIVKPTIILKNVSICIKDKLVCEDLFLTINPGLTIITGSAGSGKSTFLKVLVKEIAPTAGTVEVVGKVSYASQEPWIFPSTIKQNIIFGENFNLQRYTEVLRVCALKYDIDVLKHGDNTIICNKGINLSKGQQARINLARAVYRNSDIYLLDDCLASLDANVREFVFIECFNGMLKNKLCIFITHNLKFIKEANHLIVLENGMIKSEVVVNGTNNKFLLYDISEGVELTSPFENQETQNGNIETSESSTLLKKDSNKNIYQEKKKSGKVDMETYYQYAKFGGGIFFFGLIIMFFILTEASKSYNNKLISKWVTLEQNISIFAHNGTNASYFQEMMNVRSSISIIFSSVLVASVLLSLFTAVLFFTFGRRASTKLHKAMISSILNTTIIFFDKNLLGSILNRFSKDLSTTDEELPFLLYEFFWMILTIGGVIGLIASTNLIFLIPAFVLFIVLFFVRWCYLPTGRSLQRLEAATRSPLIGHLTASLEGLTTVRAFGAMHILEKEFDRHQNLYTSSNYNSKCCSRAFGFVLDTFCNAFVTAIVVTFLIGTSDNSVGDVGLAITQAFTLTGMLQFGVRQWAEIENKMTSVERALEYTKLNKEKTSGRVIKNWPRKGAIVFENVSLAYSNTEYVLKNISFHIQPREKIGIIGRTGAGKTTLISALFRFHEIEGNILIDDVDIQTVTLRCLRQNIGIIPQDPALFTGTFRDNIDPTSELNDEQIWAAMEKVHLKDLVTSLDASISESGLNFSAGQRQLICLSRAVANQYKILILDEATSDVDEECDKLIYEVIQENFINSTVITVAHRLTSVVRHSDRVMVMDAGKIVEFETPQVLLQNKGSAFYKLLKKSALF